MDTADSKEYEAHRSEARRRDQFIHFGKIGNGPVPLSVLEKICIALDCRIEDIVEYVPGQTKES